MATQACILACSHKGAECHPATDFPKHLAPIVAIRQWLWQALEKKFPLHHVPYMFNWRYLGILLVRAVVHHEGHVKSQQPYVVVRCPAEKTHLLSKNVSSKGLTTCAMWRAETTNVTASCNLWPPYHEAWGEACVLWANALRKMMLTWSTPYTCTSITRIQVKPTLITEYNRPTFHSPVDSFTTPE